MELESAIPLDGHDFSNFRTAVGKLIFMAPWKPDMQFAIQELSTQVPKPTTKSKRAMKQLIRYHKGTHNTPVFVSRNGSKRFQQRATGLRDTVAVRRACRRATEV